MRNPLRRRPATALTTSGSLPPVPNAATLRSRRRFARRQWRRRWLAWRYVVVLVVLIVLIVLGTWLVYFSDALSISAVDVRGTGSEVSAAQVEHAAAVPLGKPLATADLGAIRDRVETLLAAVQTAQVSREWPHTVRIDIVQRTPVAVIETSDGLHALDASGQVFLSYQTAPPGLPIVRSASTDRDALAQGAQVAAALPKGLALRVAHLQIFTQDDIELDLHSGKTVMWGSASDSATKARVLAALMTAQPGASLYDVSVPSAPAAR